MNTTPHTVPHTGHRNPYVGAGESGARRSAEIDRTELDDLDWMDPRYDDLIASAHRWDDQAHELMLERIGQRPTLTQARASVGNEYWIAGIALAGLSPALTRSLEQHTVWSRGSGRHRQLRDSDGEQGWVLEPEALIDWDAWLAHGGEQAWSSTERRLFEIIASLVDDTQEISIRHLAWLGDWQEDVWTILNDWSQGATTNGYLAPHERTERASQSTGRRQAAAHVTVRAVAHGQQPIPPAPSAPPSQSSGPTL